ncbi:hypothetical protein GCM10027589_12680 [Actinocorallia lasiicapitis]
MITDLDEVEPRPLGVHGLANEFGGPEGLGHQLVTDLHGLPFPTCRQDPLPHMARPMPPNHPRTLYSPTASREQGEGGVVQPFG